MAYSIYSQLSPYLQAVSSIRIPRMRHAVVTVDPLNMGNIPKGKVFMWIKKFAL
jgi:hypothetical protein